MDNLNSLIEEFINKKVKPLLSEFDYKKPLKIKKERDVVTYLDEKIEEEFKGFLSKNIGDVEIYGEEQDSENLKTEDIWIIDPIDGTHNFVMGIPHYAVSIAWWGRDERYGWIYLPVEDILYYSDGDKLYMNGDRVYSRRERRLKDPVIAVGFAKAYRNTKEEKPLVTGILDMTPEIRVCASGAADLAYLAEGRYNAYIERTSHAWDITAGVIMCRSIGLEVLTWDGEDHDIFYTDHILAGEKEVIEKILDILKSVPFNPNRQE